MIRSSPRWLAAVALGGTCAVLAGCSSLPAPPAYSQEELRAICQRRGGAWHPDDLLPGYCEYPRALAPIAPERALRLLAPTS
jgi:hypothetical protein